MKTPAHFWNCNSAVSTSLPNRGLPICDSAQLHTWLPPCPWQPTRPTFSPLLRPIVSTHWFVSLFRICSQNGTVNHWHQNGTEWPASKWHCQSQASKLISMSVAGIKMALSVTSIKMALSVTGIKMALSVTIVKIALSVIGIKMALSVTGVKLALPMTASKWISLSLTGIKLAPSATRIKMTLPVYVHACQVRVTVGDSGLCCCTCVACFEC